MNEPIISIVIPSFNREDYIAETLDSVLQQTYPHWECIVVDDGSTDNTVKIIEEFVQKDSRFRLYHRNREPKGANTCRNIGTEYSTGDYIIFLDSDDLLMPSCLENRMQRIHKIGENDILIKGTYKMFEKEKTTIFSNKIARSGSDYLSLFLRLEHPWNIMSGTWKSEILKKIKPFDECLPRLQDPDFHILMLSKYDGKVHYDYNKADNYHIIHTAKSTRKTIEWLEMIVTAYEIFFKKYHTRFLNTKYEDDLYAGISRSLATLLTKIKQSKHRDFNLVSGYLNSLHIYGIIDQNQKKRIDGLLKFNKLFPHFRGNARINMFAMNHVLQRKVSNYEEN
ncbi:glycosyltransferase family 2 protein [Membranicola marinus]|uniref:Glycosyltransferase family 2 protein n=1 Tax=Membranihabitans marinus TaxID=1227546 RepID=A0A953HUC2_9BACT|nr:glycosyltransferase family 2 protein [Membranihabitans marinus]MBY5956611.1 glycosyltransferase family 2 protein [Membranihabitans marinus]